MKFKREERTCANCSSLFLAKKSNQRFCRPKCNQKFFLDIHKKRQRMLTVERQKEMARG